MDNLICVQIGIYVHVGIEDMGNSETWPVQILAIPLEQ